MNRWDCGHPGCGQSVVGVGGAIGLRAIGWWFMPGPVLFCPLHRPDAATCPINKAGRECLAGGREGCPDPCSRCTAENEADWIQSRIPELLEIMHPGWLSPVLDVELKYPGLH